MLSHVAPTRELDPMPVAVDPGPHRDLLSGARAAYDRLFDLIEDNAAQAMRIALAVVFIWFGLLKVIGQSPVTGLVGETIPFVDAGTLMLGLGAVEVALGAALLLGIAQRLVLLALAGHLGGTFLTFVMAPELMMRDGNPLLLTVAGEFVLKNMVLISGALLLAAVLGRRENVPAS
ncbi:hypothetical protein BH20ACT5_BH20ACT5_18590 [soil metagenome]